MHPQMVEVLAKMHVDELHREAAIRRLVPTEGSPARRRGRTTRLEPRERAVHTPGPCAET
jgi:hypothetical protein